MYRVAAVLLPPCFFPLTYILLFTAKISSSPRGAYVGIHSSGFKDFILKPELLRAVTDCGFEHPSEVQHECIPQVVLGMDVICQAKSGMGKTAVFVLTTLHQIEPKDGEVACLVLCHTRELAFQIQKEYERFSKYLPDIKASVMYGGTPIRDNIKELKENCPHIVVGTPGRILALSNSNELKLDKLKHFVLDECDQLLVQLDMRRDVQQIFKHTPHEKQVMMFSATLGKEVRPVCKKFCQEVSCCPSLKPNLTSSPSLERRTKRRGWGGGGGEREKDAEQQRRAKGGQGVRGECSTPRSPRSVAPSSSSSSSLSNRRRPWCDDGWWTDSWGPGARAAMARKLLILLLCVAR